METMPVLNFECLSEPSERGPFQRAFDGSSDELAIQVCYLGPMRLPHHAH